jgi:cysteinyl-tRNA synthetase
MLSVYSSKLTKAWFSRVRFIHTIRISNSLVDSTAQSQLEISQEKPLTWYACGPTVYDSAHIGHARTYVVTDILRRILVDFFHFPLNFAMGITDIDDKIIKKGKERGFTVDEEFRKLAADLEKEFLSDMDNLNVRRPDAILRVTEHIEEIIGFVTNLIEKKHAYVAADGVYFDLSSMKDNQNYDKFGCASGADNEEGNADPTENTTKRNPRDFALWKITSKADPGWESPWGHGRPGWHIECSAVTHSYFGQHLDIHSGGIDLKFPHHTNEIAQR